MDLGRQGQVKDKGKGRVWQGVTHALILYITFLPTGAGLTLNGAVFPNHGVINKDPSVIGEDEDALYCVIDDVACCGTPPSPDCCQPPPTSTDGGSGNGQGNWYFPNGDPLPSGTDQPFLWYARWLTGAVLMNFRGTASTGTTGLHRCDIRDSTGTLHQFYTCVYGANGNVIFSCESTISYMGTLHQLYTYATNTIIYLCCTQCAGLRYSSSSRCGGDH